MTDYDVKAPDNAIDPEWVKEWVGEFDWNEPIPEQVEALLRGYLSGASLQWVSGGLRLYPIGSENFGEFHGWAFHCEWPVLIEEVKVFCATHSDEDSYDIQSLKALRDNLFSLVEILDREISSGPSANILKRR